MKTSGISASRELGSRKNALCGNGGPIQASSAFDLGTWVEAVNRCAEEKGYDAIRFRDGEIVVKNPKAIQSAQRRINKVASRRLGTK